MDCTFGRLTTSTGIQAFSLELPWRDNAESISCIPEGVYDAFYRVSPSNGEVIELKGVEGRTYIQFHAGNYTRQIEGCILPGKGITHIDGDDIPDVTNSGDIMAKLIPDAKRADKIKVHILSAKMPIGVYHR